MHEAELYNLAALPCIYCLKGFVEVNYRSPIHLKPLLIVTKWRKNQAKARH